MARVAIQYGYLLRSLGFRPSTSQSAARFSLDMQRIAKQYRVSTQSFTNLRSVAILLSTAEERFYQELQKFNRYMTILANAPLRSHTRVEHLPLDLIREEEATAQNFASDPLQLIHSGLDPNMEFLTLKLSEATATVNEHEAHSLPHAARVRGLLKMCRMAYISTPTRGRELIKLIGEVMKLDSKNGEHA